MTSTTTGADRGGAGDWNRDRRIRVWGVSITAWVLGLSVVFHALFLGTAWKFGWLDNRLVFDKAEEERRTAEVEKREAERKAREEAERAKKQLPDEHAKKLKAEAERRAERELVKKIEDLKRTREAIEEIKQRKLAELQNRPEEVYRLRLAQELERWAKQLQKEARVLKEKRTDPESERLQHEANQVASKAELLVQRLEQQVLAAASDPAAAPQQIDNEARAREIATQAREVMQRAEALKQDESREVRGPANQVAKRADAVAERAERLAGPVDMSAFNDVSAAQRQSELTPEQLENLHAQDPAQLYETAQTLEREANQAYADARAAELALLQQTTFAEAQAKLAVSAPARPDMSAQLAPQVNSVGDLNQYRHALDQAVQEAESMRVAASQQLSQVQGIDPGASSQGEQAGNSRYAQMMAMGSAAQMSGQNRRLDLSAIMRGLAAGSGSSSSDSIIYANSNLESGGNYLPDAKPLPDLRIDQREISAQALPGRKFSKDSARQGWLYIDTWYIIGPFENDGKLDYDRINPPEYEINFDAEYDGKVIDGKPVKLEWQFTQSEMIRVTPPMEKSNSTYYAFTELYFEQDTDMLLAIASDDAAKVWINDLLVWEDQGLSSWHIGEGFRKVFFQKGFNKVLVRIDNGPVVCQFSVLICPTEVAARQN